MLRRLYSNRFCKVNLIRSFVTGIALLLVAHAATAQLRLEPTQRKNPVHRVKQNPAARTQALTPVALPFWDDFSFTKVDDPTDTLSNYPLSSLWTNSNSIWVSRGIGLLSPTVNVASFDGLDSVGLPYSDVILANGFRDSLTSQPVKLGDVLPADRNTVFLSFYYQWQGNGEGPDPTDFFRLSFKDNKGIWTSALEFRKDDVIKKDEFYYAILQIDSPKYFHNAFQFRFENYGRRSGPYDTWNVDYVYLNQFRTLSDNSYPDRALASEATRLFGEYYAVPVEHFFVETPIDTVEFDVKNMKNAANLIAVGYGVVGEYKNYIGGSATTVVEPLVTYAPVGSGIFAPQQRVREKMKGIVDPTPPRFNPAADSIDVTLKITLISGDDIDPLKATFTPIDFRINDTLSTTYHLDDYYAYDDGTADYSAMLSMSSDTLAYAFDMATDQYDTIVGFDVYFAGYGLAENKIVDFFVFSDDDGSPGERLYTRFAYTVEKKAVNQFQRVMIEPVRVRDRFYIGYRGGDVKIGLDKSNDTFDKIFNNTNGTWLPNEVIHGALMFRPLFGKAADTGPVVGIPEEKHISIYPNPNEGTFRLDRRTKVLQALTLTGQSVPFDQEEYGDIQEIRLHSPAPGLYLLRLQDGNAMRVEKIVVR